MQGISRFYMDAMVRDHEDPDPEDPYDKDKAVRAKELQTLEDNTLYTRYLDLSDKLKSVVLDGLIEVSRKYLIERLDDIREELKEGDEGYGMPEWLLLTKWIAARSFEGNIVRYNVKQALEWFHEVNKIRAEYTFTDETTISWLFRVSNSALSKAHREWDGEPMPYADMCSESWRTFIWSKLIKDDRGNKALFFGKTHQLAAFMQMYHMKSFNKFLPNDDDYAHIWLNIVCMELEAGNKLERDAFRTHPYLPYAVKWYKTKYTTEGAEGVKDLAYYLKNLRDDEHSLRLKAAIKHLEPLVYSSTDKQKG